MSQQTNSGFNAPGFSIGADEPGKLAAPVTPFSVGVIDPPLLFSYPFPWVCEDFTVGHVAAFTIEAMLPRTGPTRPAAPPWLDPYC
jgi:hypothetical protein